CTTAVPGRYGEVPPDACNSNYFYDPSFGANIAFAALFGLTSLAHIVEACIFKKRFCWVVIMGSLWEVAAFILRALGAWNQQNLGYLIGGNLFFLLAPLWINAFVYMTGARLIHFLVPEKRISFVKASSISKYFIWLDIFSFLIQGVGGSMLSDTDDTGGTQTTRIGLIVYRVGIGIQELFILGFFAVTIQFHRQTVRLEEMGLVSPNIKWRALTWAMYVVLVLITVRIVFRIVEFSSGVSDDNPLLSHEGFVLCLDALPMVLALLLTNVVHPGMVLRGPESEFTRLTRKEKKALKMEKKEAKKARKEAKKAMK
ncbi:hypothetical protein P152DRAFT_377881, partial [Eremomyces bilateralis CBS 781.70]